MNRLSAFYRSSVGKKFIVALTGLVLIGFIIGHLLGNLQIFLGPDVVNGYAQKLRDLGLILWLVRAFLLVNVIAHIYFTISLTIDNRRARPDAYAEKNYTKATFASRYMWLSGLVVLAFVLYHLAHFTFLWVNPEYAGLHDPHGRHDVFSMMVYGFRNPVVSAFYILSMFLLMLHLTHGASSFFQSLGWNEKTLNPRLATGGRVFAWLIFLGYTSIPVAVLAGLVQPAQQL
ncbi:MAG TPA: succinate dehydrogenase cytochrome b subunit [Chthoniobacterales bacterium]|nr:succinate dehydrogenase cytochrome b subunit [Chthoniobacterales bacterium]